MRRAILLFSLVYLYLLVPGAKVFGQNSQSYLNDVGSTAYGINIPVENGYINVSNGNLHLEFPLSSPPQRGALTVSESLVYDSRIWMFSPFGTHGSYHWWPYNVPGASNSSGGWRFIRGDEIGSVTESQVKYVSSPCNYNDAGQPTAYATDTGYSMTWIDPSGTSHVFDAQYDWIEDDCAQQSYYIFSPGNATDGSGYLVSDDGSGNPIVTDVNYTEVFPQIIDRYGNYLSTDLTGNLQDDTGRVPVIVTQNGNTTYYDILSPNGTIQNNGSRIRYTVTSGPVNVSTNFAQSDTYEWISSSYLTPVQSILLPDGSEYTFTYDIYGEMSSMTLPTGGVIIYGYSNFLDSANTENRWLASWKVGSNPQMTFTPRVVTPCSNYSSGCKEAVAVQRPSGDSTIYDLTIANGAWNTAQYIYTGTVPVDSCNSALIFRCPVTPNGSQALQFTTGSYTYSNACIGVHCAGANYLTSSLMTTELFSGGNPSVYTQTQSTYDPNSGKPLSVKTWDYAPVSNMNTGTAPTSTPIREVDYTYYGSLPWTVKVLDSFGNQAGLTTYSYSSTATPTSGVPQHGSQNSYPFYLQSVSHWLNTNSSNPPTTYYLTDDTGMVTSTTDPSRNPTTISYQCGNSLPYQITNALNQTSQFGYDCASGAITSYQDPNDLAASRPGTTYSYEGTMGRLSMQTRPDMGVTSYTYATSAPYTETDTAITATPDPPVMSKSVVDAFGRPYTSTVGNISTGTTYDVNGRQSCVINPYTNGPLRAFPGGPCITSYDGLDRPLVQTQADGVSTIQWGYNSNVITTTDEASNPTTRTTNVLGELTSVQEATGTQTAYTYDGLGNLQAIVQSGIAANGELPVTSTFTYDSLSRVICEAHAESSQSPCPSSATSTMPSGVTLYTYNPTGTVHTKTDARPVTTSYVYDALNRVTDTSYNDGSTASTHYDYDSSGGDWDGLPITNQIGRLAHIAVGAHTLAWDEKIFSYDAMGRMVQVEDASPSEAGTTNHVTTAKYDSAGNMIDLWYPRPYGTTGPHIQQQWDPVGRLSKVYAIINNTETDYWSAQSYFPDGTLQAVLYANGVTQQRRENARLQTCELSTFLSPTIGGSMVIDRQNFFTSAIGTDPCVPVSNNNGNILQIVDNTNPTAGSNLRNQTFSYDALNRLKTWSTSSMSGSPRSQNYTYDSFGNMAQIGGNMPNFPVNYTGPNLPWPFDSANHLKTNYSQCGIAPSGAVYDLAGNVLCQGSSSIDAQAFLYDAESRVAQVYAQSMGTQFNWVATYTYDAEGNRVRKDLASGVYTEYSYFNGVPLSEKDQNSNWTDYIYAGGQKIAKVDMQKPLWHMHGVRDYTNGGCGSGSGNVLGTSAAIQGQPVINGDMLVMDIRETNTQSQTVATVGILFASGDGTGYAVDENTGMQMVTYTQGDNQWHHVVVDLSAYATQNKVMNRVTAGVHYFTGPGTWDIWLANMAVVRKDGSVLPIFTGQLVSGPDMLPTTCGGTNQTLATELTPITDPATANWNVNTNYYMGDHLGTTQMEFSTGGWPVWQGNYAPFGQEVLPGVVANFDPPSTDDGTAMRYKFGGYEADAESDLDHTMFRQLSPAQGRWMSPDPYNGSLDTSDPQSINRYAYVGNMPLNLIDPTGLDGDDLGGIFGSGTGCLASAETGNYIGIAGACGFAVVNYIRDLFHHAKFTASNAPRPSAHPWDEHGGYTPTGIRGIGDILGLPQGGCEFGACGYGFAQGGVGTLPSGCIFGADICSQQWAALVAFLSRLGSRAIPIVAASATVLSMQGDNDGHCMPREGTQCYDMHTDSRPHNGWDIHFHLYQMNYNPVSNSCFWNKLRGPTGTVPTQPQGIESCAVYPNWTP